jgi:hypothetical protein
VERVQGAEGHGRALWASGPRTVHGEDARRAQMPLQHRDPPLEDHQEVAALVARLVEDLALPHGPVPAVRHGPQLLLGRPREGAMEVRCLGEPPRLREPGGRHGFPH